MTNAEPTATEQLVVEQHRVIGVPFKPGQSGNPSGRPRGSRNRLADAFVTDLRDCWQVHGRDALERVARDEPSVLLKVVASLMPKDLNLSISTDPAAFALTFRAAVEMLGNPAPSKTRRPLPNKRTIEHQR
jgi:hypothetical protein